MKHPEPYYRSDRQTWCVQIGERQITLRRLDGTTVRGGKTETRDDALKAYHRLMAAEGVTSVKPGDLTVVLACDLYLDVIKADVAPSTFEQYRIKLQSFSDRHGKLKLSRLRARHLTEWAAAQGWSDSTRRGAITYVKLCLAWCVREGHLAADPFLSVKRPRMGRRERTVTPDERAAIRAAAGPELFDFLDALGWTGCRPGEIMRLESGHIDWETCYAALPGKTTKATGDLIEFPLVPPMLALCRRLAERNPAGPLFRNTEGNPWTPNAVRCAMRRLRARLKLDGVTAYTFRHSFATDALERGLSLTDVAALMNHKDVRTTMGYSHLKERREHLRRQAGKVSWEAGGGESQAPKSES